MRRFRAIVIAVAIVANLVMAIPTSRIDDDLLDDPEYRQGDVENWYRWTGGLGLGEDRFRSVVLGVMSGWRDTVKALRAPFQPFFSLVHTNQQWGLFAVVGERKETVVIEVRRDGEWETLYRRLDPEHTWHDDQLKYRRIRGVWDGVKDEPKGTYKRLTEWIAKEIFLEQPDVDRVRVVLERTNLSLPWEPEDTTVERRAQRYHRRHEIMGDEGGAQ
ncbi:MAG: hypothetical protein KC621_20150 [Myxococcales bacterium]|nr:hypothetical protein [Myxococcales bacterium]